jgi:hypothetical protein
VFWLKRAVRRLRHHRSFFMSFYVKESTLYALLASAMNDIFIDDFS